VETTFLMEGEKIAEVLILDSPCLRAMLWAGTTKCVFDSSRDELLSFVEETGGELEICKSPC